MDTTLFEIFDHLQKMADRSGEAIQPDDDQHVAVCELAEQSRQNRARPRCARTVLLKNPLAAGGTQLVHLSVMDLVVSRNACIADKALRRWRCVDGLPLCHDFLEHSPVHCTDKGCVRK